QTSLWAALYPLGEVAPLIHCVSEARALAEALGDRQSLGWVACHAANHFWLLGDMDRALETIPVAYVEPDVDLPVRVEAGFRVGQIYWSHGEFQRAVEYFLRSAEAVPTERVLDQLGLPGFPSVLCRAWAARALTEVGEFAEGTALSLEALRIAESTSEAFSLSSVYNVLGQLYCRQGKLEAAVSILERGHQSGQA